MKKEILKFSTGEPITVQFKYDTSLPTEGKFGMQYYYRVKQGDKDCGFYATEKLNEELQSFEKLVGRTLKITKKVDLRGMHYWDVRD